MNKSFCARVAILFCAITSTTYAYDPRQLERFIITHQCERCDLNELNFSPEILGSDDFTESVLTGAYVYGSSIERLNFSNVNAQQLQGLGLMLHNNELSNADFSYADLPNLKVTLWNQGEYVNFMGANIDEANFSYSQLYAPNFFEASMSSAVLYHVNWPYAYLYGARLRGANLTYAVLNHANLQYADLSNALLNHANLSDANLLGAMVTDEQLANTASICNAVLPDGSIGYCVAL
ncbi:MAG: pentapeptide repeat-containing protein [Gammaproteobacteria bacterium]|jgi:uncharacterized protein YjbI with pentapeptide repeats